MLCHYIVIDFNSQVSHYKLPRIRGFLTKFSSHYLDCGLSILENANLELFWVEAQTCCCESEYEPVSFKRNH